MDLIDILLANKLIEKKLPPTILNLRGSVATTSQLPLTNNHKGDVWVVQSNNAEYVWMSDNASGTLSDYEDFGPVIDLSPYRTAADQDVIDSGKQAKVTASGILKGDGNGGVSAAAAGTDYADVDGNYIGMTVGISDRLSANTRYVDSNPYSYRISGGGDLDACNSSEYELVGATVNWNQLVQSTGTSVTVPNSHKYIAYIGANKTVGISDGTALTVDGANGDKVFDITSMFGAAIADYIYELEDATAGSGIAWFRKYFPKDNYNYSSGGLQSVCVFMHRASGFNAYNPDTSSAKVLENTEYEIIGAYTALTLNGSNIIPVNGKFTPTSTGMLIVTGGDTTTCIHIAGDGSMDGEYASYEKSDYILDGSKRLRGRYILDGSKLKADGDIYYSDGYIERHYTILTKQTGSYGDKINLPGAKPDLEDIVTSVGHLNSVGTINGTTLTLNTSVNNIDILYELAVPVIESANSYEKIQKVNALGYEEYIDASVSENIPDVRTATVEVYNGEKDIPTIVQLPLTYSSTNHMYKAFLSDRYELLPEVVPGKYFAYWECKEFGPCKDIISSNSSTDNNAMLIAFDAVIRAVYSDTPIENLPTACLFRIEYDASSLKMYTTAILAPQTGRTTDEAGILAASNNAGSKYTPGSELTEDNADYVKKASAMHSGSQSMIYTWSKTNVGNPGEIWYLRSFAIYTDDNNVQHTIYGDMETVIIDELRYRDVEIPAGHSTRYVNDLRSKLEDYAEIPNVDGQYLIQRSNGKMTVLKYNSPIPAPPSENGSYTLKCTISSGTPTFEWVSDT